MRPTSEVTVLAALATLGLALAGPAPAAIHDCTSGCEDTSAAPDGNPVEDPGFLAVGRVGFLTGVYLGGGWMITASHVLVDEKQFVVLDGDFYDPLEDTQVQLTNPSDQFLTNADMKLFRIEDPPTHLPAVKLSTAPVTAGESVVMVGYSRNRGTDIDVWDPPDCPLGDRDGWAWDSGQTMSWGTNVVSAGTVKASFPPFVNHFFELRFDRSLPTSHEAISTAGDSGGAVFAKRGGSWELVGIMFAAEQFVFGPDQVSLLAKPGATCDGFDLSDLGTDAVDVFVYRAQIDRTLNPPSVSSASPSGRALAAALLAGAGCAAAALLRRR